MNPNFLKQYQSYSNIDLLKIVKEPDSYQPAALEAAQQILADREISEQEITEADSHFRNIETAAQNRREKIESVKNKAADFFEPVLYPGKEVKTEKWLNILLVLLTLQYSWTIYQTIRTLIFYFNSSGSSGNFIVLEIVQLIYIPVIFYLLLKRKRWGWILLFADNLFIGISLIDQSFFFFKYLDLFNRSPVGLMFSIMVRALFAYFLWQEETAAFFKITPEIKRITAAIALTIILALTVLFRIMT